MHGGLGRRVQPFMLRYLAPLVLVATCAATPAPPAAADTCALDASWLTRAGGGVAPVRSTLIRYDAMQRRGGFGETPTFHGITRQSEETYEYANGRSHPSKMFVRRGVVGSLPANFYDAPKKLASGVIEYPPKPSPFPSSLLHTLFVFPGGTQVVAPGDIAARVRTEFALPGKAPPLPPVAPDVAWETAGAVDVNDVGLPHDVWRITGDRTVARLFGSRKEAEVIYGFASAAEAGSAAREQAGVCRASSCAWMRAASAEGSRVRYTVDVRQAPTSQKDDLVIARVTPPLAAPPAVSTAPGAPPSGTYQRFMNVTSDTCPTRSTGQPFPSFMGAIEITHRGGQAFTTLESVEPRTRGLATASPMPNVELRIGSVTTKESKHLDAGFTIARKMTVLAATGDLIRVRDEVRYVGTSARHPNLPGNCEHTSITSWVLARKTCDAACDGRVTGPDTGVISGDPAPRYEMSCRCP